MVTELKGHISHLSPGPLPLWVTVVTFTETEVLDKLNQFYFYLFYCHSFPAPGSAEFFKCD